MEAWGPDLLGNRPKCRWDPTGYRAGVADAFADQPSNQNCRPGSFPSLFKESLFGCLFLFCSLFFALHDFILRQSLALLPRLPTNLDPPASAS